MSTISLTIIEIIVLMLGAVTLGITIHFFITNRNPLKDAGADESGSKNKEVDSWKSKYFNDIEIRDKEIDKFRQKISEIEENNEINVIEAEEKRKENKILKAEIEALRKAPPPQPKQTTAAASDNTERIDYMQQLKMAQSGLLEHNEKINHLFAQIDIVKETEEKQKELLTENELLKRKLDELQFRLSKKDIEISEVQEKAHLTKEMTSMLDNAYSEFELLQNKIQKLEKQLAASKSVSMEFNDLKESYYKSTKDLDEYKLKYNALVAENKDLLVKSDEMETKLREVNFHREQLQKKVTYLEELRNDMHEVGEVNKNLQSQLKRLAELESMINIVAEERDELAKKQQKNE